MTEVKKQANQKRLPEWMRIKINKGSNRKQIDDTLRDGQLVTVCEEAKCPNLAECWHQRTATFMLMGANCTRACRFCAIGYKRPEALDLDEPKKVADAAAKMGLKYVVITSVARDDLPDEGAGHFAETVRAVRAQLPEAGIEILTPDFNGKRELIERCIESIPTVFNHNLETCERLSRPVRGRARYDRSLEVLRYAKEFTAGRVLTKSGIMVGLGETDEEVIQCLRDLKQAGVDVLTLGQYLPPSRKHWKLDRYVHPDQFAEWKRFALEELGFRSVASGPMVRSSYKAGELVEDTLAEQRSLGLF